MKLVIILLEVAKTKLIILQNELWMLNKKKLINKKIHTKNPGNVFDKK